MPAPTRAPDNPNPQEAVRAPIESAHNKTRDDREKQYVSDRNNLEMAYHADLVSIQQAKQNALAAAGLNPDGSNLPPDPITLSEGDAQLDGSGWIGGAPG